MRSRFPPYPVHVETASWILGFLTTLEDFGLDEETSSEKPICLGRSPSEPAATELA